MSKWNFCVMEIFIYFSDLYVLSFVSTSSIHLWIWEDLNNLFDVPITTLYLLTMASSVYKAFTKQLEQQKGDKSLL